nr:heparinase II/III family protein [Pseudarthrobacter defluvii]
MVARETAGSVEGLLLAAKGGHNGEHHNHRDVGSVVVAVDGVPLLVDAGQPTYTAKTFGPDRYDIRAMQSSWHNVPAPHGLEQGTGSEFTAHVLRHPTADQSLMELALGAAYGFEPGQWVRTSGLDRDRGHATIADRWELPPPTAGGTPDVDITYLTAGALRRGPDGTATVEPAGVPVSGTPGKPAGRGAVLRWEPASAVVLVDEWELEDPLLADIWGARLTRLRFRMPASTGADGAFTLTVEATS